MTGSGGTATFTIAVLPLLEEGFSLVTFECARQDSNLRSRLRRALLCTALAWPYVLNEALWGAYGARKCGA